MSDKKFLVTEEKNIGVLENMLKELESNYELVTNGRIVVEEWYWQSEGRGCKIYPENVDESLLLRKKSVGGSNPNAIVETADEDKIEMRIGDKSYIIQYKRDK